jgi:hypothetical protein
MVREGAGTDASWLYGQIGLDGSNQYLDPRYGGLKLIDHTGQAIPFNEILPFENDFFKGRVGDWPLRMHTEWLGAAYKSRALKAAKNNS